MTKRASSSSRGKSTWLPRNSERFWTRLQVFPNAIAHGKTKGDYAKKAKVLLEKSGIANLRYLCDMAGITYRPDLDSSEQLANRLLNSGSRNELLYLCAFMRSRKNAVVEYFDNVASEKTRKSLETDVAALSKRKPETPKPITKLVRLYSSDPSTLEEIHYRHSWRRLPTIFSFLGVGGIPDSCVAVLSREIDSLIPRLNKVRAGETYESFGHAALGDRLTVFVIHRRFPPTVRSDYEQRFRVQHDYSILAFAIDRERGTLLKKLQTVRSRKKSGIGSPKHYASTLSIPALKFFATTLLSRRRRLSWVVTMRPMA